jgi:hypothetical protein
VVPHTTGVNKLDRDFGVAQMASSLTDHTMSWIYAGADLVREMAPFEAELLRWRPDVPTRKLRQDMVMSAWFGWLYWQKYKRGWADADMRTNRTQTGHRLPWTPTGIASVRALKVGA